MNDEHWNRSGIIAIGPIGKAVFAGVIVLLTGLLSWQALTLVSVSKTTAVMNYQLRELTDTSKRADKAIPDIQRLQAEHEVRINALEQQVHEMRQVRDLK